MTVEILTAAASEDLQRRAAGSLAARGIGAGERVAFLTAGSGAMLSAVLGEMLKVDAPSAALTEVERQQRINEDVLRYLTVRVDAHEEGPSAMMRKADRDRERDERGFGDRGGRFGDRDRGERRFGDRDRGGDRGERRPRDGGDEAPAQE